ncbi:MAG: glycoside hydrolase family 97 protein [Cytophagales bacterium]|nr:glycoside hydrolase family 97 protein [Cytophagales bacterium]
MNVLVVATATACFLTSLVYLPCLGQSYDLNSPNGRLQLRIEIDGSLSYQLSQDGQIRIDEGLIDIKDDRGQSRGLPIKSHKIKRSSFESELSPVVAQKTSRIKESYNELLIELNASIALRFRAYDEGMAYRLENLTKKEWRIGQEILQFEANQASKVILSQEQSFISHNEMPYVELLPGQDTAFCSLPLLIDFPDGACIVFTEADVHDYPGTYMSLSTDGRLMGHQPAVVLETAPRTDVEGRSDRNETITREAGYIALSRARQNYPWRVFLCATEPVRLLENQLVYLLSRPSKGDFSWVQPGKVAWDWWNANNLSQVDFEAGINTKTYQYYIDFAAQYCLEYIILDEGWSPPTRPMEMTPEMDVPALVEYGKKKGVGLILWLLWKPLDEQLEAALDLYASWGVKGIKVDFMQRSDQYMVQYYERVARACADRQLLVDFHGAFKPTGLQRTYPNAISYEAVLGLEHNKWDSTCTARHNTTLPFVRMTAGPMDYTPGAMRNAIPKNFAIVFDEPMSQTTRAHQVALYMVFESPLQMLADSPSHYLKDKKTTEYVAAIPSVWDQTCGLAGRVGEFIVVAAEKGPAWYLAAITNEERRQIQVPTDFYPPAATKCRCTRTG